MTDQTGKRRCCDDAVCPKAEFERLFDPDDPIEQRIDRLACAVAATCSTLIEEELGICFEKLFGISPDCRLFDRFSGAYQAEREALRGQRVVTVARAG